MKRSILIASAAAAAVMLTGAAYAGPNDAHPYPVTASKNPPKRISHIVNSNNRAPMYKPTASKNPPKHIDHIVNANNRAPMYKPTAKPEPALQATRSHHLKHHHA